VLVDPEAGPAAAAEVVGAALGEVDGLVLHDAPWDGPAVAAIRALAPWARRIPGRSSLVVAAGEPALARRRREVAYEIRRARRLGTQVTVEVAGAPDDVAGALEVLLDLHRRRWEGGQDVSGFSRDAADVALHRRAVADAARAGMARIAVVREDGRPVAACLSLVAAGGGMLYRNASAPPGRMRGPGVLTTITSIDALLAAGADRVDLGIGRELYKRRMGPASMPSTILVAAATRRAQPALTLAVEGRRVARDLVRAGRGRLAAARGRSG
jgi:CelD/BcsL family acetyltransferase involved in cellulose biosynthesis